MPLPMSDFKFLLKLDFGNFPRMDYDLLTRNEGFKLPNKPCVDVKKAICCLHLTDLFRSGSSMFC